MVGTRASLMNLGMYRHPEPSGVACGAIWNHLEPSGAVCSQLVRSGAVWSHLEPLRLPDRLIKHRGTGCWPLMHRLMHHHVLRHLVPDGPLRHRGTRWSGMQACMLRCRVPHWFFSFVERCDACSVRVSESKVPSVVGAPRIAGS